MNNLEFYTPSDIPKQIRAFDSEVKQLAVGKSGKIGYLRLVFQNDNNGKTIVGEQFSQVPLHAQRALYCEDSFSNLAFLYIVSVSGGILQGDRYRIDVRLKKNSMVHITTQGATRIHSMNSNSATQMVNITLEENSYLEFIPDQIIPYQDSRFYQRMNLNVHDSATLFYSEIITPGRVAMGESFEYDVCYLKTRATNQNENLRFIDITNLEPKIQKISSFGILGKYTIVGSAYILTKKENVFEIHDKINSLVFQNKKIIGGASIMKNNSGILVRILGNETEIVKKTIFDIARLIRKQVLNAPFSEIRKN
jgi:urease accessory protein